MKLSYWEYDTWFNQPDFCIIGSGIVGLSAAYYLRIKYPKAKIIVLEKGFLPAGASTKNAGFACFGSISELIADRNNMSENEIFSLIEKRWKGLLNLRKLLGDDNLQYENSGGFELFKNDEKELFERCAAEINYFNASLKNIIGTEVYSLVNNTQQFNAFSKLIKNNYEGQINTGKMMLSLLNICRSHNIDVLNGVDVKKVYATNNSVEIEINENIFITAKTAIIATNGFAQKMFPQLDVKPARAQVLITEIIENLHFSGTYHYDAGYYYFRNVGNRILLGGGRNIDFNSETTEEINITEKIQNALDKMLYEIILPGKRVNIEKRWAGIMGVGAKKYPIIDEIEKNVWVAVRMGGMGVAIGSMVGKEVAEKI
jgi:glycine/D-amino acid oxidase-like deaminating enzyme